ncbi:MAG TPA: thermonuclease family protein [Solirubrobacterales bacterium]|nr:thermonuclease family protein [Solirubrobacterales bacterium]
MLVFVALLILRPWDEELSAGESGPGSVDAYITRVVDGDTVEARIGDEVEDVRLIGIDTPETVKPEAPVECFGPQASSYTHRLLEGQRVRLVFGVERRDIYDRLLAYAYIDHRFVNAELVRRGLARTLEIPPNTLHSALFRRLELKAARGGRGLWGAC